MEEKEALYILGIIIKNNDVDYGISDIQELVLCQSWVGLSYQEIAEASGYDAEYIKQIGSKLWRSLSDYLARKVTKKNLRSVFRQYLEENNLLPLDSANQEDSVSGNSSKGSRLQDWGDAIAVKNFVGRESELDSLTEWLLDDRCRLISILGMGGIGKTAIASQLARKVAGEFEFVFWRSLRNAPVFDEFLAELILFISRQEEVTLPDSLDARFNVLLRYLAASRCLLVLDNVEPILVSGQSGGYFKDGYEGYGQLFRQLADCNHQSCLLLTSREQPQGISPRDSSSTVRSLKLSGLSIEAAQILLQEKGVNDSQELIQQYRGNPLAIRIAATTIKSVFAGNVENFLTEGVRVFGDIWDLLEQQFQRLSPLEQTVMFWLAVNREEITLTQLKQDVFPVVDIRQLLEIIESLQKRSLIETKSFGFTQQPVIMEYVTSKLIELMAGEIIVGQTNLLKTHAVLKTESFEYLREMQMRLVLEPLMTQLMVCLETRTQVEARLRQLLGQLRSKAFTAGYAGGNILNLLKYLQTDLTGWDFSELPLWQADLREISLQKVNFSRSDLAKSLFAERMGSILALELSADGKILATGDNGQIRIWQMPECKHVLTLFGHENPPVLALALSPDGRMLASGSSDRDIKIWEIATGKCVKTLLSHQASIWSLAFSSDGKTLASASGDGTIKLWDTSQGIEIASLPITNPPLRDTLCFSPDGSLFAASTQKAGIQIWQLNPLQCLQTIPVESAQNGSIAFGPEGRFLAVSFVGAAIKLWDIEYQTWELALPINSLQLMSLRFAENRQMIAGASSDCLIRLWSLAEGRCVKVLRGHRSRITSISLTPDDQILVSGSEDGSFKLWEIDTGRCLKTISGYNARIWSVQFSYDGNILASSSETGLIRLWDWQAGISQDLIHGDRVKSISFSPDGKLLASINYNYQIKLWCLSSYRCLKTFQGDSSWSWAIAFSPNSKYLVTAGGTEVVYCWDISTGNLISTLTGHQDITLDAVFLHDSETVATTSSDKTVKVWNISTGECLQVLRHPNVVWSVAYNQLTNVLATGSEDGIIRLWDLAQGGLITTLEGHSHLVISLDWSKDGRLLASGSNDCTSIVWNVSTRKCLTMLKGHQDSVFGVTFNPQSQVIATGSHDETVKIWDIETGTCHRTLKVQGLYEGLNLKDAKGLSKTQKNTLIALGSTDSD